MNSSFRISAHDVRLPPLCDDLVMSFVKKFPRATTNPSEFAKMYAFVKDKGKSTFKHAKEIGIDMDVVIEYVFAKYASEYTANMQFRADMVVLASYAQYLNQF